MTASNPKFHIPLNVMLDTETDEMLERLALDLQQSKAQTVRSAIRTHFNMRIGHQPICANGEACRMPQAFTWTTSPAEPSVNTNEHIPPHA